MKKGLLSILAGALLVVGCQNYDDQFDALESQINALASTVAGLSQVQSDLASLSATVSGLQGALQSGIDAALADGLADIDAAVADLEAATANAASAEDVAAIQTGIDANSASLEELLAQSSVFQGSVVVNTPATLDAYHAMGTGLAIINGSVDIDVSSDMDIAKTQELVDFILVTTGDFAYTAGANVDTEVTFNNLSGVQSLTLDQEGGYKAQSLESATVITLDDDSSVTIVDLRALTSVTSLSDGSGAGTFTFNKATELHLTALPRSPHGALSLGVDEGGVIDISALKDVDAAGKDATLDLTISGPASLSISNLSGDKAGSDLIVSEVANLTVNGYDGKITLGQDVGNFTADNIVDIAITGDDLVSFTGTGALDGNATTADTAGPALTLNAQGDLTTVTLDGTYTTVTLTGNGNMESATIGGTVTGAGGVNVSTNSDLITLNVSGLTTDKLVVDGNSDLETLTVDFTTGAGEATTQEGTITVNNNESMTSLTITTDNVDNLAITHNADLETIDLAAMTSIGATGTASVSIAANKLEADLADDENDSFTSNSGMASAKVYLDAVAADADSKANVIFDNVESVEDADGTETSTDVSFAVLTLTPKVITTPAAAATKHRVAVGVVTTGGATKFGLAAGDGSNILVNGSDAPQLTLTLDANETLAIAAIKRSMALTRATAYDMTLDAHSGYKPTGQIRMQATAATATAEYSINPGKNAGKDTGRIGDYANLTIDGLTASVTLASESSVGWNENIVDALVSKWTTQYGTTNSASYSYSLFTVSTATGAEQIDIAAKDGSGRRGFDKAYSISYILATTTGASVTIAAEYGATSASTDNNTISGGIVVTIESNLGGTLLDVAKGVSITGVGAANVTKLSTTELTVGKTNTTTTKNIYPLEARGDARLPEAAVTEVATAATSTDRTAWL